MQIKKSMVVIAAVTVASLLMISFGASNTGLFHLDTLGDNGSERLERIGDWVSVGWLEVTNGDVSVLRR